MNFVTYEHLRKDTLAWEKKLPAFDAVCGVPRSGLLPASYVALKRNLPMVALGDLIDDPTTAIARAALRDTNPRVHYGEPGGDRILVIDDAVGEQTVTIEEIRRKLKPSHLHIEFAAVYRASESSRVNHFFMTLPQPRMFEWNWLRHWGLQYAMCDMDGVLCEDWKGHLEQDEDERYVRHLTNAKPLYVPQVPIRAVVTSRLRRYLPETKGWLERHKIEAASIVMHPAESPHERRVAKDYAKRKAAAYVADPQAKLFVESDTAQAKEIAAISGKPVLCTENMSTYG